MKHRCSFFGCGIEIDSDKREVAFVRIQKGMVTNDKGERFPEYEGFRSMCLSHEKLIYSKRLPRTLELIFGKRKQD